MKKILFTNLALLSFFVNQAQEVAVVEAVEVEVTEPKWKNSGNFAVLANQSSFSNWQAGGDNSFAGSLKINYDLIYQSGDWSWDSRFQLNYGLSKIKGQEQKKTDDRLEINSVLGKQMSEKWYYSIFFNFKTQMDSGFDKDGIRNSHFMSPAYLQIGPGMLWKDNDNLRVNIAPFTSRFTFVDKEFTKLGEAFGVHQNKSMLYQLGMSVNGYYKFNAMENVNFENILNLYSNYLNKPENVVIDYQLNIVLQVNKYLSTNFTFQAIYDDNAFKGFQLRETLGVGINYTFK
nr:DUF3078 domain-containing protein [uncultured Flavobacterium sp.]